MEAYYEPQFNEHSHGFRPDRGCGTALREIAHTWRGTAWFIEGDIKGCFDTIDHTVLLSIIAEKVHDNRFLRLIGELLKAGYVENWRYNTTLSGTPQGGIVSPLLANIYLDRLDQYVTGTLIPKYTRGPKRAISREYHNVVNKALRQDKRGRHHEASALRKELRRLPSVNTNDPEYRRLRYVRYADDFLLGFAGTREEAETIKTDLEAYLRDTLKLTLSAEKTLVTHARADKARFLGYELSTAAKDDHRTAGQRTINGLITLEIPPAVVRQACSRYMANNQPTHRAELLNHSEYDILTRFQAEYRGVVNYYRMAHNLRQLGILKWTMERSLARTLAYKRKVSVPTVYRHYHATIHGDNGKTYKGLCLVIEREGKQPLVATWGGITLARKMVNYLPDTPYRVWSGRTELLQRLLAEACELCGSTISVNVHHIRKLADLRKHGRTPPRWVETMAARKRKTLVLCHTCHVALHAGRLDHGKSENLGEPDDAKVSRPVRRGADGTVPA